MDSDFRPLTDEEIVALREIFESGGLEALLRGTPDSIKGSQLEPLARLYTKIAEAVERTIRVWY